MYLNRVSVNILKITAFCNSAVSTYFLVVQSNAIKGEKFILEFSEIFPINGTFYNGNIGENNQFILDFPTIFPFNGVRLYLSFSRIKIEIK